MEIKRLEGAVEAILFAMGESVELGQIAKAIQQDKPTTEKLLHNLMDKYKDEGRGIQIIELEGSYQLCTKRDYYGCLIRIAMQPKKPALTDVMLETLSIIAYKQPVTKAEIEKIRGVKSDHAVNKLVEYNLVKELGRLDAPGRPILFGTTEEFLRTFGVQGLEELPAVDPVKMADFKAEAEEEARRQAEQEAQQDEADESEDGQYDEDGDVIENADEDTAEDDTEAVDEDADNGENDDASEDTENTEDNADADYDNSTDASEESAEDTSNEEDTSSASDSSSYSSGSGSSVVNYATQFVGNPYVWGGTSLTNGADCSGFVQSVYANFGVSLPRTSYEQQNAGTEVSYADAQPGDLICYDGHIGIYIGNGQIVNAQNPEQGIGISPATYTTILSVRRIV